MYWRHFGFGQAPFSLTPNTEFFFSSPTHQEAMNVLLIALEDGEGFVKVTGEVGLGKTMLCRTLLARLPASYVTAFLPNPELSPTGMHQELASELGIADSHHIPVDRLMRRIGQRLLGLSRSGKKVVMIVDEAQALPLRTLESIRLLSNLETEKRKLLQIVLFGQPELDQRLHRQNLRQLNQRITFAYKLLPFNRKETAAYLRHRLEIAGHEGAAIFSSQAITALHRGSAGVPRLVNILAHKALMVTFGEGKHRVSFHHVRQAAADTDSARRINALRWLHLSVATLSVLGILATFGLQR